jgi:hypothetical protein
MIADPAWMLDGRSFCCRNWCNARQLVVCHSKRSAPTVWQRQRKRAARDTGIARTTARPKGSLAAARRAPVVVQFHPCPGIRPRGVQVRQVTLYLVGHVRALHLQADVGRNRRTLTAAHFQLF